VATGVRTGDSDTQGVVDTEDARLAVVVAVLSQQGDATGLDVVDAFGAQGWPATPRTGQRWLLKARDTTPTCGQPTLKAV
jgi:hypothetical protein